MGVDRAGSGEASPLEEETGNIVELVVNFAVLSCAGEGLEQDN